MAAMVAASPIVESTVWNATRAIVLVHVPAIGPNGPRARNRVVELGPKAGTLLWTWTRRPQTVRAKTKRLLSDVVLPAAQT